MATFKIRPAAVEDCEEIFRMSEELNIDEKLPGSSEYVTVESLKQGGFGDEKFFHAIVVETIEPADGLPKKNTEEESTNQNCSTDNSTLPDSLVEKAANQRSRLLGYATYSFCFGTYGPGRVLFLQDIYVEKEHRRKDIGKALFIELAKIALSKRCQEVNWHAFSWNSGAVEFYKKLRATNATTKINLHSFFMDYKDISRLVTESKEADQ
ncbi:thialysine N-epsilon-acetyltransferase-like [Gigantopelta aegis]|uniref:thialysine N-epsilon-acetyltransferase-like n=1 Tax=Gigantopelta aegis TaxID=1735272 RepID=UPI001B8890F0|nr:thialysine N-epsilon-acetyltransferase-like [Gigantopelta aegis]